METGRRHAVIPWLAQAPATPALNMWNAPAGTPEIWMKVGIAMLAGFGLLAALIAAPTRLRRPISGAFIFLAGLFWVLVFLFPKPIDSQTPHEQRPRGFVQDVSFWLADAIPVVSNFSNILTAFILGLGVFSLVRIHLMRVAKKQNDWPFSVVLLVSMVAMATFGYWDWKTRLDLGGAKVDEAWPLAAYGKDLLFDGMLQVMEAAMFSLIAFFILSAAYRAFRIRSVEATILLCAALIAMLNLMGAVVVTWDGMIESFGKDNAFLMNFTLSSVAGFIRDNLQTPGIRAIDFGIGLGALAMGLRLWLSLERVGGN